MIVDIAIPVVERDRRNRLSERLTAFEVCSDFIDRHEFEVSPDPFDMPLEHGAAHEHGRHLGRGRALEIVDHAVVGNHERTAAGGRRRQ